MSSSNDTREGWQRILMHASNLKEAKQIIEEEKNRGVTMDMKGWQLVSFDSKVAIPESSKTDLKK